MIFITLAIVLQLYCQLRFHRSHIKHESSFSGFVKVVIGAQKLCQVQVKITYKFVLRFYANALNKHSNPDLAHVSRKESE